MTSADWLSLISITVTLLLGFLVYRTNKHANKTHAKKLTLEEQVAEDERGDKIAERRRIELNRLYDRLDKLEASDREKSVCIENLEREVREIRAEKSVLLEHLDVLEAGYPSPPGPPPRPLILRTV